MGGPFASLGPARAREHCDVLVRGELEPIAERFFADRLDREYEGATQLLLRLPDLAAGPCPVGAG